MKSATKQTGYTFVSNVLQPYSVPGADAEKIYELTENVYVSGLVRQMLNLVLPGSVSISVYDDKDDVVETVSRHLNQMFSTASCSLNACVRTALSDLLVWGLSPFNWVWSDNDGEIVCTELNHLHPFTFRVVPSGLDYARTITGRLLKGVYYSLDDRSLHYAQYQDGIAQELDARNLFVVRDPAAANPDGDSLILPIAPVVDFLNYCWNALGQQMYRVGAPIMFITIADPMPARTVNGSLIEGDVEYAQRLISQWGKDTGFALRDNMTVNKIDVDEKSLAIVSIGKAGETIRDYISPVGMLGKEGSLIAGSSDANLRLINNSIHGWSAMLSEAFRALPNYYLSANGFPASWHAEVNIPSTTIEDTEANLEKAKLLWETKRGSVNEFRELLGMEGVSEEEIREMVKGWGDVSE